MNYLILIPERNQAWLQIGAQCAWLHSKNDIHPNMPPKEEGVHGSKWNICIDDNYARNILFEWLQNGPMDFSLGEQTMMRLPDDVREFINVFPYKHLKAEA